jgi:hypothetical protein
MARSRMSSSARRPVLSVALASACACAAFALFPKDAHAAAFDLGIDGDLNALVAPDPSTNNLSTLGTGLKLRFGDRIGLRYGLHITPEVGWAFDHIFPAGAGYPENMNRIFAGARLGFGKWVIPTIYAHLGVGFRSDSVAPGAASAFDTGVSFDTGVAVDFRVGRHLMIGPHAEYVFIDAPATIPGGTIAGPQWLAFGGHLDILF